MVLDAVDAGRWYFRELWLSMRTLQTMVEI